MPQFGAAAADWHPVADIARVAEHFVASRSGSETEVQADMLDGRLKLARCEGPLRTFLRPGAKIGAKTIVGVQCSGATAWKVYVPVNVAVFESVWVARRPMPRGHLLTSADLASDRRDVSRMTSGYIPSTQPLLGQRLRQGVLAGRAMTPALMEADDIIRRGQSVTLKIAAGSVHIRMAGKALADGALNQRIRVENLNSGRIVEGVVRSGEVVEVLLPGPAADKGFFHATPKVSPSLADTGYSNNDR